MYRFSVLLNLLLLPLLGWSQAEKDTVPNFVRTWKLIEDYTTLMDHPMDTTQTGFQIYSPVYEQSICQSYLGNLGLQTRNNIYFNEDYQPDFFFLRPFNPYLYTPENNVYYNITKPFTMLEYFGTIGNRPKREEMFRAVHTQNINPFLNVGFDIRLIGSEGQYLNQKTGLSSLSLWQSYTGKSYSTHASFHLNRQTIEENGGLRNDSVFIHTSRDEQAYPVNLENAKSRNRNLMFQVTQRYRFGKTEEVVDSTSETGFRRLRDQATKTGSLIHTIEYQRSSRLYQDRITAQNQDFYPDYFIDPSATDDSTYHRSLSNTLQLMLDENPNRENDFGARAYLTYDFVKYAHNIRPDTQVVNTDTSVVTHRDYAYQNLHIGASFLHTVGVGWDWIVGGRYYLLGYRRNDLILNGSITKTFQGKRGRSEIRITGNLSLLEQDHFLNHYESNHYRWHNDFKKTKDIRGSFTVYNEAIQLRATAHLSLVTDLVFFNDSAHPVQHRQLETVMGAELHKHFKAGIFHSDHKLYYQFNSNSNVIRLPEISYRTSNYIAFNVVKNALRAEIGFDFHYYTPFRAMAFAPSSGVFHHQDVRRMGNYPYLNPFINAKLKRTRFFFRFDHMYAGLIKKNYFHVYRYPVPGRFIRFGLSWTFYD